MPYLVQVSGQSPEFEQLVLFQSRCQLEVIKVVKVIDRISQGLVILLLDQQIVVCVIDSFNVVLLNGNEVRLDERDVVVVISLEHANNTGVVDSRRQDG